MALLDTPRTSGRPAVFAGTFQDFPLNIFSRIAAWNDARRTRAYLETLSADQLDDIGLTRGDIDKIASGIRF